MPDSFSTDGHRRIRRLAWIVRLLSLVGALFIGTLPFVFWAQPDWVAEVAARTWSLSTMQLDLGSRLWGLAAMLLPTAVSLFTLWQMWSLFGCFAQGELLARRPAAHLRRLGLGVSSLAAAQPLGHTLAILALEKICINGGRRGYLVGIAPRVLTELLGARPVQCANGQ